MATATLHIGTMKTGTTYLQGLLQKNPERLADQNWLLPDFLPSNHMAFPLSFAAQISTQHQVRGMFDDATRADYASRLHAAVEKQITSSPTPSREQKWIISSEQYMMRLRSQREVVDAIKFLLELFDSVSVVVFFRRGEFILPSLLSQRIKDGWSSPSWDWDFCEDLLSQLDPIKLLNRWGGAVGEENVTAVPYLESYKSDSHTFLSATSQATSIKFDDSWIQPQPVSANRSLSAEAMGFLALANQHIPRRVVGEPRVSLLNQKLKTKLTEISDPALFVPDQGTLDRVTDYCAESYGELLRRFPGDSRWQTWIDQAPQGALEATPITLSAERALELAVEVASPNGPVWWGEEYGLPPSKGQLMHRYWDRVKRKASRRLR